MTHRHLLAALFFLFGFDATNQSVIAVEDADGTPAATSEEATVSYNKDIRPILTDLCFACHGADEESRAAGLRLDVAEEAFDFGAIIQGDADGSEIIARIRHEDPDWVMPPPETKKSITPEQEALLVRWINQGAKYEAHWSFEKPEVREVTPANQAWRKNSIDDYVASTLDSIGLSPAEEAEPRLLFRRLHLDITGLSPSPEDAKRFVKDYAATGDVAYAEWIDRLMAKPTWGEHRARYWLDAARYGDTHGLHFDNYREMWPYRDWVIRAFNQNQRFDRFIVEQLAGDLLKDPTESQLIATGFQRCNITTNEGGTIDDENLANYAADRVQTFGWVFLGLTTNCAQCHDHKFDPLTTKDYYSLAAFFRNTTQKPKDGNSKDGRGPILRLPTDADRPRWDSIPRELASARTAIQQLEKASKPAIKQWLVEANADSLRASLPAEDLVIHAPLDEGFGNDLSLLGQLPATLHAESDEFAWKSVDGRAKILSIHSDKPVSLGPLGQVDVDESFSVTAWLNFPREGGGGVIAKMDPKKAHRGWDLFRQGNQLAVHLIDRWPENALKVSSTQNVVRPGKWQHVAFTYDGSGKIGGIKLLVDGEPVALRVEKETLQAEKASFYVSSPLQFGARDGEAAMKGLSVDAFRIYAKALKLEEIKSIAGGDHISRILATRSEPTESLAADQLKTVEQFYLTTNEPKYVELLTKVASLTREKAEIEARSPITHIQRERMDSQATANILMRGQYDQVGEAVTAETPVFLHPMNPDDPKNRLGLARWLVDVRNPLTARVTVNRFWQQIFGRGLVPTTEDFGITGTLPADQDLLDFLAIDFRENDWDVKRFFKQVFMSATYRQAAKTTAAKLAADRDNAHFSRGPRFRMDAEMIRDSALANSGLLSSKMFGPGTRPYQPTDIWNIVGLPGGDTRNYRQDEGENLYRRTIYNFWKRMAPPPSLEALNAPSREVCVVRRERTNTPLQALVTLNDPQFVEAARHLAETTLAAAGSNEEAVQHIVKRVLCRPPLPTESIVLLDSYAEFLAHYESNPEAATELLSVGESPASEEFPPAVLATWTLVCNQVMNLDEALCK